MTVTRRDLLACAALLTGMPLLGQSLEPKALAAGAQIDLGEWTLVDSLSDDFDTFDAARWRKGLWYPGSANHTFQDGNVEANGGSLRLWARSEQVDGKPFTFGAVESRFDTPGLCSYVEVRARCLDSAANILSAVWLQSSTLTGQDRLKSEPNPEIDVQENISDHAVNWAHHLWPWDGQRHVNDRVGWQHGGNGGEHRTDHDLTQDYHLYGVERREGHVRLYYDRVLYADIDTAQLPARFGALARMSRHVVLSLEDHSRNPHRAENLPASFDIDYVRTYTYAPANVEMEGKVRISAPDGRLLAAHGSQLVLVEAGQTEGAQWQLTRQDDLSYVLSTADGAVLSQKDFLGLHDQDLEVVLTQEAPTGPDDQGSLARWFLLKDGASARIMSRLSGLPLVPADGGVVVNGTRSASWALTPVAPEPDPEPQPQPAPQMPAYVAANVGRPGAMVLKGDWDGNGQVTYAVRVGSRVVFYNENRVDAPVMAALSLGRASDKVYVGDWDGDGADTLALVRGSRVMLQKRLTSIAVVLGATEDLAKARKQ